MPPEARSPILTLATTRRLLLLAGLLGALGAVTASVIFSYRQNENDCFAVLGAEAKFWGDGTRYVVDVAEGTLNRLAAELPGKSLEEIQPILRQAVFDRPLFREAGWIVDGNLVCTSQEIVNPPKTIWAPDLATAKEPGGLYFLPPVMTYQGGPSLIVNRRVDDRTIVDVLISPNSLLVPLRKATRSDTSAVYLVRSDGTVLLSSDQAGSVMPLAPKPPREGRARKLKGISLGQRVGTSDLYVVALMPRAVMLEQWRRRWPVFGLIGVTAAALFLAGAWQMRKRVYGLRAELREAVALGQLQPYFQPVIELETGKCEGAELLMRWIHPVRGTIPPALFVPEAEASGLIGALTLAMLKREAPGIRALLTRYPDFHLKLNLSTCMLDDNEFLKRLTSALGDDSLLLRFHFELTESVSADDKARRRMEEFKAQGISLAVDDFGTGYSNLRYLKDLPFDYLKIDKAFVDGISSASESSGLVDSIILIGKSCGLKLIAEGVERAEQLDYLRKCGVESAQGFYISPPLTLEDFELWLDLRKGNGRAS